MNRWVLMRTNLRANKARKKELLYSCAQMLMSNDSIIVKKDRTVNKKLWGTK